MVISENQRKRQFNWCLLLFIKIFSCFYTVHSRSHTDQWPEYWLNNNWCSCGSIFANKWLIYKSNFHQMKLESSIESSRQSNVKRKWQLVQINKKCMQLFNYYYDYYYQSDWMNETQNTPNGTTIKYDMISKWFILFTICLHHKTLVSSDTQAMWEKERDDAQQERDGTAEWWANECEHRTY